MADRRHVLRSQLLLHPKLLKCSRVAISLFALLVPVEPTLPPRLHASSGMRASAFMFRAV